MSGARLLAAFLLLSAQVLLVPEARAATTCTASMGNMAFGPVDSTGFVETSANVTVTCNSTALSILGTVYVRMCLNAGEGAQGGGLGLLPRRMISASDALQFQMYTNSTRTLIWGSNSFASAPTPLQIDLSYAAPLLGGSGVATRTLYGRVPAQALAAGTYENVFSGIHTSLQYRYDEPVLFIGSTWPASCTSGGDGGDSVGTGRFPFTASTTVPGLCAISAASDLDFGSNPGTISANRDYTSAIGMTCRNRTVWNVGLNNGQNASGSVRRMRLGATANYVTYELYSNPGRTVRWGNTVGTDTLPGTSSSTTESLTVHGRVPATQAVIAGTYSDVITVTVTY